MMDMVSIANRHELARVSKYRRESINLKAKINTRRNSDLQEDKVLEEEEQIRTQVKLGVGQSFLGTYRGEIIMGILWLIVYILLTPLELIGAMILMRYTHLALGMAVWLFAESIQTIIKGEMHLQERPALKLSRCKLVMVMTVLVVSTVACTVSLLVLLAWETQLVLIFCSGYFLPQLCTYFVLNRPTIATSLRCFILLVILQCFLFTSHLLLLLLFASRFILLYLQFRVDPQLQKTEQIVKKLILVVLLGWIIWDGAIGVEWGWVWGWQISLLTVTVIICMLGTRIIGVKYVKKELFNHCYSQAQLVIGFAVTNILLCCYQVGNKGFGVSVVCVAVLSCAFSCLLWLDSGQYIAFSNKRISNNDDYVNF